MGASWALTTEGADQRDGIAQGLAWHREAVLDILRAVDAIEAPLSRGPLIDGLVFDAVRVRLIARMRDVLSHHYFDTWHAILEQTVRMTYRA